MNPQIRIDREFHFATVFDSDTGAYVRSGVYKNGKDTGVDPFRAAFPHLVDVGIMGSCAHGKKGFCRDAGVGCYQKGAEIEQANMTLEDFTEIVLQCKGKVDQFALGGRGDPNLHENFAEILKLCRNHGIVPNFTTSGYGLTQEAVALCKQYCGAVAVSWYRNKYTAHAIEILLAAEVKTNIHYVLGANTIDEAIERLLHNGFPKGINAVIFLLHKPVGLGNAEHVLSIQDSRMKRFFEIMDAGNTPYKFGIDSCTTPGVITSCSQVDIASVDTCEGGRFSCYISSDMKMVPCSFDQAREYAVSLREHTIKQAWESPAFARFRDILNEACPDCKERAVCLGGCPLLPSIVLCDEKKNREVHKHEQ